MEAIRSRGLLRVGLRQDGLPWAFRNQGGRIVGFDVDLLKSLASNLGVRLQVQVAPMAQLEQWLADERIDLVAGGIQTSPRHAIRHELSLCYLPVHLALVVADGKVKELQRGLSNPQEHSVTLAVRDAAMISPGLQAQIAKYLGDGHRRAKVELIPIESKQDFF